MAPPEVLMVRYPTSASCLLAFLHVSAFGHMQTVSCKICMHCHLLPDFEIPYKRGTKNLKLICCSGRYWRVHDRIRWRWRVKVRQEGRRSWSDAFRPPKTRQSRQAVYGWYIGRQIPRDPYVTCLGRSTICRMLIFGRRTSPKEHLRGIQWFRRVF
jgi:hypothetical protein